VDARWEERLAGLWAALDELGEKIPGAGDATGRIVFAAPEGKTLADPAYQQAIGTVIAEAKQLPGVTGVIDPTTGSLTGERPDGVTWQSTGSMRCIGGTDALPPA